MFSWSILLVASRIILLTFDLDPWLFTFIQMMAGGLFLILMTGQIQALGLRLRDRWVWIYGILRVMTAAFFTAALIHTSAANAAFLAILSVPTSVLLVWAFLRRRPSPWELPGHILVLLGLVLIAGVIEGGWRNPAIALMILSELCVVCSTLIAELHPQNQSEDMRQRAGLTGLMLLASAFVMLVVAGSLTALALAVPSVTNILPVQIAWVHDPLILLDPALWGTAVLMGVALRGPSMFLALGAIYRVGTTNYLAALAALPLVSMLLEALAIRLNVLAPTAIWSSVTLFGCIMVVGSLLVIWSRARHSIYERILS
ncbi:MAG: hypothetical protein Gyms2KO_10210 [Gymnodinialimonas sp.]